MVVRVRAALAHSVIRSRRRGARSSASTPHAPIMAASSSSSSSSNLRGQLNIKIEEATNVFKTQGRFATPYVVVYAKNTAIGQVLPSSSSRARSL